MKAERFGDMIRSQRRKLNKTILEMSGKLGVSVAYYSEVELGKRPPFKQQHLVTLAKELEMKFTGLLIAAWQDKNAISLDPEGMSFASREVLARFARGGISDQTLEKILNLLNDESD